MLLCDSDQDYAQRMAGYVRDSDFRKEVELTVCSSLAVLSEVLQREPFDLLIINEEFAEELEERIPGGQKAVWITEREGGMARQGMPVMTKYDSAPRLLRRWMEYAGALFEPEPDQAPSPPIVAVWSAAGGVGKTKLVSAIAKSWLDEGIRLFIIGLDPAIYTFVNRYSFQFHDASEWLYEVKAGREVEAPGLEGDESIQLHCFLPECSYREFATINRKETAELLKRAASRFGCGAVLVDAGTGWSPFIDEVWGRADSLVCVSTEEEESLRKTDKWFQEWEEWSEHGVLRGKTQFVINKSLPHRGPALFDWAEEGFRLPYVPEWKQESGRTDAVFEYRVQQLAKELWDRCKKDSHWNL